MKLVRVVARGADNFATNFGVYGPTPIRRIT